VQRRTFLARTFAGPLTLARLAYAQRDSSTFGKSRASVRFETGQIDVAGNKIFYRRCGQGPAILPVHAFPRTSQMWRFLAPKLSANHTVIYADLPDVRPKRYTRVHGRPFPLFEARDGPGTGRGDGQTRISRLYADRS